MFCSSKNKKELGRRYCNDRFEAWLGATRILLVGLFAIVVPGALLFAASPAAFTSVNETVDGTGHCQNGNPNVNCNIYGGKQYVWMNGGPLAASLADGSYFFAVLDPSGQSDPNDGTPALLSLDSYSNRTFSVSGGVVSYLGTHDFDSAAGKIRLMPYADTTNPGGVYIMSICSLASGYPVAPSECKYDAFKAVLAPEPPAIALSVVKNADGTFDTTYHWNIAKSVDQTVVKKVGGGLATFNYTVTLQHDSGVAENFAITGSITVKNYNTFDVKNVDVVDLMDDPNATCTIIDGLGITVPASSSVVLPYTCSYSAPPVSLVEINNVTATWPRGSGNLEAGSSSFSIEFSFVNTLVDECVDVTDTYAGVLGTVCQDQPSPIAFNYSRTISIPLYGCLIYPNTASFLTSDMGILGSASQSVEVCGPIQTGALTMGFWQNKNGQLIINSYSGAACQDLRTYLNTLAPFGDLAATTCSGVSSYVLKIIKNASAAGASMNAMLKAQMLATSLDVYFSDPDLGGNRIEAATPIGAVAIDLTFICKGIGAGCSFYEDASSSFGGATSLTVSAIQAYAASQSDIGGSLWYANVKSVQELAKDVFDAINNRVAFAP